MPLNSYKNCTSNKKRIKNSKLLFLRFNYSVFILYLFTVQTISCNRYVIEKEIVLGPTIQTKYYEEFKVKIVNDFSALQFILFKKKKKF